MSTQFIKPPESVLELLRKVKALADTGAPGERAAARERLNVLLLRHRISEEQLLETTACLHGFRYRGEEELMLLCAIVAHVACNGDFPTTYHGNGKKDWLWFKLTTPQFVDVETWFRFYKEHWSRERRLFFRAFIHAQNLATNPSGARRTLTDEELRDQRRIANLKLMVDTRSPRRELPPAAVA